MECEVNIKKSIVEASKKQSESEISKTIPLKIASKIKFVEINFKKKCKVCTLGTIKHCWEK